MIVIKRDGRKVLFNRKKIREAVLSAFNDVDGEINQYAKNKANEISLYVERLDKDLSVEEIQDIVIDKLKACIRSDVAESYEKYRKKRARARQKKTELIKEVGEKLSASNVQNQNANVDEKSFGGRKGEAANVLTKQYALDYKMSDMARDNHLNNMIYTHDLDSYAVGMHNCLSIPFDDLLANGFNIRQTDIRPANSVSSAFQLIAVIFQIQSLQQFGGVSATHIDWTMVPYVRKSFYKHYLDGMKYIGGLDEKEMNWQLNNDMNFNPIDISISDISKYKHSEEYKYAMDMTEKELRQAVEALYHNLNSLQSRSGNQLKWMAG